MLQDGRGVGYGAQRREGAEVLGGVQVARGVAIMMMVVYHLTFALLAALGVLEIEVL